MATKGRPNGHKIYQHLPLKDPTKFTRIGIFGLKIYHPTTLLITAIIRAKLKTTALRCTGVNLKPFHRGIFNRVQIK
jgi:hypothetical protein